MADAVYDSWKDLIATFGIGGDHTQVAGTLSVNLVTSSYTYNAAHEDEADLGANIVATETLDNPTVTGKVLDGDDVTFTALSGSAVAAVVIFMDTGTPGTSRLVAYLDSLTGLPFTPSGADATIEWDASGILDL